MGVRFPARLGNLWQVCGELLIFHEDLLARVCHQPVEFASQLVHLVCLVTLRHINLVMLQRGMVSVLGKITASCVRRAPSSRKRTCLELDKPSLVGSR